MPPIGPTDSQRGPDDVLLISAGNFTHRDLDYTRHNRVSMIMFSFLQNYSVLLVEVSQS